MSSRYQLICVFIAVGFVTIGAEECSTTRDPTPPSTELLDPGFWVEFADGTKTCLDETKEKKKLGRSSLDGTLGLLWTKYENSVTNNLLASIPCGKKNFDKLVKSSTFKRVRSGVGAIPIVGSSIQSLWDAMTGGTDNTDEIKDEIWKANAAVMCALGIQTEEIRGMINEQTEKLGIIINNQTKHIDEMINNQTAMIKNQTSIIVNFVKLVGEDLKKGMQEFRRDMNDRFNDVKADLDDIKKKLTKISAKISKMSLKLSVFDPLDELYSLFQLSFGQPRPNDFTVKCKNDPPLGKLSLLVKTLENMAETKDMLEDGQFSDEAFDVFYQGVLRYSCDAVELFLNCPSTSTREQNLVIVDIPLENIDKALEAIQQKRKMWYFTNENLKNLFNTSSGAAVGPTEFNDVLNSYYKSLEYNYFIMKESGEEPTARCFRIDEDCVTFNIRTSELVTFYIMRTPAAGSYYICPFLFISTETYVYDLYRYASSPSAAERIFKMERFHCDSMHSQLLVAQSRDYYMGEGYFLVRMVVNAQPYNVFAALKPCYESTCHA